MIRWIELMRFSYGAALLMAPRDTLSALMIHDIDFLTIEVARVHD